MRVKTTHRILPEPGESLEIRGKNALEIEVSTTDQESAPETPISEFVVVIPSGAHFKAGRYGKITSGPAEIYIFSDKVRGHFPPEELEATEGAP